MRTLITNIKQLRQTEKLPEGLLTQAYLPYRFADNLTDRVMAGGVEEFFERPEIELKIIN